MKTFCFDGVQWYYAWALLTIYPIGGWWTSCLQKHTYIYVFDYKAEYQEYQEQTRARLFWKWIFGQWLHQMKKEIIQKHFSETRISPCPQSMVQGSQIFLRGIAKLSQHSMRFSYR